MRTVQVTGGFYKIKIGDKDYKVYASDLKMISKRRKAKRPPVPSYNDDDYIELSLERKTSQLTEENESIEI